MDTNLNGRNESMEPWPPQKSLRGVVDKSKLPAFPAISECDPTAVTHTASDVAIASELTPHRVPYRFPPANEASYWKTAFIYFTKQTATKPSWLKHALLLCRLILPRQFTLSWRVSATQLHWKNTSSLRQIKKSRPHHRHPAHHLHLESSIATVKHWKPIHLKLWELYKASHPLPSAWRIQIHVVAGFHLKNAPTLHLLSRTWAAALLPPESRRLFHHVLASEWFHEFLPRKVLHF